MYHTQKRTIIQQLSFSRLDTGHLKKENGGLNIDLWLAKPLVFMAIVNITLK